MSAHYSSSYYSGNNPRFSYVPQHDTNRNHQQATYPQPLDQNFGSAGMNFMPNQFVPDMAVQYGSAVLGQGTDLLQKNKWAINSNSPNQVLPSDDINVPDLYIPFMASVTYILLSGFIFGMQDRFSPEYLGVLSSQSFGWILLEVLLSLFAIYILNIQSTISYLDLISYSGYKFVSMIAILLGYILLDRSGYYFTWIYASLALAFFLTRTLKSKIFSHVEVYPSEGHKRRVYLLLMIAFIQPFIMWWLTSHVLNGLKSNNNLYKL